MLWLAKASSCLSLLASLTMNIRTICGIGVLWRLICLKRPWRSPKIITGSQKILTHRVDNSALPLWAVTHGLVLAWEGMYPLPSPHGWTSDDGGLSAVWQQSQNYSKPKMQPGKGSKGPCLEKSGRMFLEYIEKQPFSDPGLNLIAQRVGSTRCCILNTCFIPPHLLLGFSSACVLIPAPMRYPSTSSAPEAQEALVRQHFESDCPWQGNAALPVLQGTCYILCR